MKRSPLIVLLGKYRSLRVLLGLSLAAFCIALMNTALIRYYTLPKDDQPKPPPRKIEISIPQKVSELNDVEWWTFEMLPEPTTALITEEAEVKIHLPSGRDFTYKAINLDLFRDGQTMDRVYLRLDPVTKDYQQAINNAEAELKKLGVNTRDECVSGLNRLRAVEDTGFLGSQVLVCFLDFENRIEISTGLLEVITGTPGRDWATFLEFTYKPK